MGSDPSLDVRAARGLAPSATVEYSDYRVVGGFSQTSGPGRFLNPETSGDNYWEAKGIPKTRDERQMGHYFDMSSWQDEQNARQQRGKQSRGVKKKRVV